MSGVIFHSDYPIEKAEEDRLDRASFAKQFARSILYRGDERSLVIGLHGVWGSGKTSVKNMVLEELEKADSLCLHILEFNPWHMAGEAHVADAFFLEVGQVLRSEGLGDGGKERAQKWMTYARHFKVLGKAASVMDLPLMAMGIPSLGIAAAAGNTLGGVAGMMEQAAEEAQEKQGTIDEARRGLVKEFGKLKKRILVVIDDLDRLTDEEIRVMLRVVKGNLDFPNIIFLLLFQKSVVAKALNPICGGMGEEFLQKIVQVDLSLPAIREDQIAQFWMKEITSIFGTQDSKIGQRLSRLWQAGLKRFFTALRDITRFVNAVRFTSSGLKTNGVWEINIVDFLVLETLRLFESELYESLYLHRDYLVGNLLVVQGDDKLKRVHKSATKPLEANRTNKKVTVDDLKELLGDVFPVLREGWVGTYMNYGSKPKDADVHEKRACVPSFFESYFNFALVEGSLSESTVQEFVVHRADRDVLKELLSDANEGGYLFELLERLRAEEELLTDSSHAYILALSDLSDQWGNHGRDYFLGYRMSANDYVEAAVDQLMQETRSEEEKKRIFCHILESTEGILVAGVLIMEVIRDDSDAHYSWPKFTEEEENQLKKEWLQKVRRASEGSGLDKIDDVRRLVWLWHDWGDKKEAKEWFQRQSLGILSRFLAKVVSVSSNFIAGGDVVKRSESITWKVLEKWGDHEFWQKIFKELSEGASNDNSKHLAKLLNQSLECWRDGIDNSGI